MTSKQMDKVRRNAYKYYDEIVFENQDWSKREISILSFSAGADYALKNKYDELKENPERKNDKPNIVQFLKDNGVYEMFFANLFRSKRGEELSCYFLSFFFASNAISAAFIWDRTPEGQTLWSEISDRWEKQF